MINVLLAANIVLTPFGDVLGEISVVHQVCDFTYTRGTELYPGTALTIDPYSEHYGEGSMISPGDGMTCGPCAVYKITYDSQGRTVLYCRREDK